MSAFSSYRGEGYCEVTDGESIRAHYTRLIERFDEFDPGDLDDLDRLKDSLLKRQGITFAIAGSEEGLERTWPLDLVPRVVPHDEWTVLEAGLRQRVIALNMFLEDIYMAEGAIVRDGVVPAWMVESSSGYLPEAHQIAVPAGARCVISGIDLVRDNQGVYRVLEDNLRVPSGISYVLENRAALTRVLPVAFQRYQVRPVGHFGASLLSTLRSIAPAGISDPTVVVLTPGVYNSAYFEHAFIARLMGAELVEGHDLVVIDQSVFMRTTQGLERVHVIYRRIGDEYIDPVVFRNDSLLGVPGLIAAAREGTVTIANAIGNGVADDKGMYAFVPDIIRYYLGEDAILPNVTTYLPWEPDQLEHVLSSLDDLVVKPVGEAGGHGIVIGRHADERTIEKAAADLRANPRGFVVQDTVDLSTHPTYIGGKMVPRHVDLRPFVLAGANGIEVIPGGLTRVALEEGSLVVNSSAGGGSKDTWVSTS